MSDKYEIYEYKGAFGSDKRVLKNGKAVNEFGLLKDIQKLQAENADLQDKLEDEGFVLVMGRDEQEELEKLREENIKLKKQSQWINTDDELPETDTLVMIYDGLKYDFAKFNGEHWTRKAWPLGYIPKYWMPLTWCHL